MRIMVNVENVTALAPSIWTARISPENLRKLSPPISSVGMTSVLLVEDAEYGSSAGSLSFPIGSVRVLNLGATDDALFVGTEGRGSERVSKQVEQRQGSSESDSEEGAQLGFGDRECLRAFGGLAADLPDAAKRLVQFVRRTDPNGDFRREGQRFVNRPDNWVTLQPQPQIREIMVTFKGAVETDLKSASARRPYQGFKISSVEDVGEAERVLRHARRRI